MGSKSIRNLIIALIILLIGIRIIIFVFNNYLMQFALSDSLIEIIASVEGMSTLLTYGIIVLIIIAIPFYLSRRSEEKGKKQQPRQEDAE